MRKIVFAIIFSLTLTLIPCIFDYAYSNPIAPPGPVDTMYIHADGSIDPSTAPLQKSGSTYSLTQNLNCTSIQVECSGITLDGQGFSDSGYSMWYTAITLSGVNDVTIKNFHFHQFSTHIEMGGGTNIIISGNSFTDGDFCIQTSATNCQIIGNKFYNNFNPGHWYCIQGHLSTSTISNNLFSDYGISIQLFGGGENMISGNQFTDGTNIFLQDCSNNIITKNIMTAGNPVGLAGLLIKESSGNTIYENSITQKYYSSTATIPDCYGITMYYSSCNNIVYRNIISSNLIGIQIGIPEVASTYNPALGEALSDLNNQIYQNNIINNIRDNAAVGKTLDGGRPDDSWDNGVQGNYWSDYLTKYPEATEVSDTGTGNIPYVIATNNVDQHPLMNPVDIHVPTPAIVTTSLATPPAEPSQTSTATPTQNTTPNPTVAPSNPTVPPTTGTPNPNTKPNSYSDSRSIDDYVTAGLVAVAIVCVCSFVIVYNKNRRTYHSPITTSLR
ncbi:MAG: right-handed parallel beta-helix repeat-containing protein [Candidatus Bathyarchaeota archaeon]|nr:right-handed parallel beta-helix repeat-containing protein [Candidatus Bathyarchaeota archaeon]